jgi:TonB family protein
VAWGDAKRARCEEDGEPATRGGPSTDEMSRNRGARGLRPFSRRLLAALALATALGGAARAAEPGPEGEVVPPRLVEAPEPAFPDGFRRRGMPAVDVVLTLTISADGAVTEVVVTRGAGEPWDGLAVSAARGYRFTPATVGGVAVPVTVPFTFAFRPPPQRGRGLEARGERGTPEAAPGYVFAGLLAERGTRTPQAGVPVLLRDTRTVRTWESLTDEGGRFVIEGLPRGRLQLDVFTGGFEPLEREVDVRASSPEEALAEPPRFYLTPGGDGAYRTIVREERPPAAATVVELTDDELTRVAGTLGDPTRVVASLPGVARSPFGLGYFVVRGAQLDNTGFFIDGHPAVFLYHLLGGPGVIHPQLVGRLSFYPGGYPAQYGRVASAAIAVETRDPERDRFHLDLEMDLFKAGLLMSTPFDDGKGVATVAVRRSYFDLLLPLINDDIDVSYTDYQLRASYDFSERVRGRVVALGAVDKVSAAGVATADGGGKSTTDFGLGFHRLNVAFDFDLAKTLTLSESAMFEYDFIDNRRVAEGDDPIEAVTSAYVAQLLSIARWRPEAGFGLDGGLDVAWLKARADLRVPSAPPIGDPRPPIFNPVTYPSQLDAPYLSVAPFASGEVTLGGLRLLPGLRVNVDQQAGRWVTTADPKFAFRWQVDPDWTVKGMAAIAHQPPQLFQIAEPFGDAGIPPVEGRQTSLGFEWAPDAGWFVSLEGFYQHLDHLVRPSSRLASEDGEFGRVYWDDDLEGRAYGAEVLIRKELGGWVHGWLSYTLSRAERLRPPAGWGLFEFDQTHVLNLAWTFRLGRGWSLGTRFQLASGNPYYPIVSATYDADRDAHIPTYATSPSRLPAFHRLDLRLDRTIRYETWMLELFLDIQNVYNAQNQESPRYSYDYRIRTTGVSLPILPTLGFRMVF